MHLEAARKEYKKARALYVVDPHDVAMLEHLRGMLENPTEMYRQRYEEAYGVAPGVNGDDVREEV